MISTRKSFVIKALPLVLIVFSVFTITLSENLELADGFLSQSTSGWKYEMSPGESQVGTWTLLNPTEEPINVQFRAEGKGGEFFVFEEIVTMEPNSQNVYEFIVSIPKDHPDNVEYHPQLFALQIGDAPEGGAAVVVFNYQMIANPKILIGDNPVFTPEPVPIVVEEEPIEESSTEESFEVIEEKPMETVEEKLKRIQAANEATKVDDDFEESFEEEAVTEYEPEPEYIMEPKDVTIPQEESIVEEKIECDFFAMILSWFGIGKC